MICLTGAGDRAFCAGGDQKQRAETGDYGPSESGLFEVERLHRLIRDVPKPVIAAVNGVAIGGGHVLHVLCDVTIAASTATFGQVGPRVGSFDGGFGTAYLARVVGEKRAREIWFRCRRYDAATAERWGLVNEVVPDDRLRGEVREWADDMLALSPTALRFLKQSFNADTEHIAGIALDVVQRARAVRRDRRGARGRAGVQRESRARFRELPGVAARLGFGPGFGVGVGVGSVGASGVSGPGGGLEHRAEQAREAAVEILAAQ